MDFNLRWLSCITWITSVYSDEPLKVNISSGWVKRRAAEDVKGTVHAVGGQRSHEKQERNVTVGNKDYVHPCWQLPWSWAPLFYKHRKEVNSANTLCDLVCVHWSCWKGHNLANTWIPTLGYSKWRYRCVTLYIDFRSTKLRDKIWMLYQLLKLS